MTVAGHEIRVQKIDNNYCKKNYNKDYSELVKDLLSELDASSNMALHKLFALYEEEYDEEYIENVVNLAVTDILQYLLDVGKGKRKPETACELPRT